MSNRHLHSILLATAVSLAATPMFAPARAQSSPPPAGSKTPMQTMPHESARADGALDLAWLERTVLERNPSLAALRAAWRQAEARGSREAALMSPRISVGAAPQSFAGAEHGDHAGGHPGSAYRVELEQPLPRLGQRRRIREVAAAEAEEARSELEQARLDLVAEVRRTYYDDYHAERRQAVSLELSDMVRAVRKVTLARYASGQAGQHEVLQADFEIAMLEHEAVAADRDHRIAMARLLALLHFDPVQRLPRAPSTLPVPDPAVYQARLAARDTVVWPERNAADAAVAAARARVALARTERLPQPMLGVGYDRFMDESELRPMITASIDLPFLTAGSAAAVREARAELERAEARREVVRDEVEFRLAERRTRFFESLHELENLGSVMVPAAERAASSLRAAYESGRTSFGELMTSLRALKSARLELHRVLATANLDAAELDRALAGPSLPPARKDQP